MIKMIRVPDSLCWEELIALADRSGDYVFHAEVAKAFVIHVRSSASFGGISLLSDPVPLGVLDSIIYRVNDFNESKLNDLGIRAVRS